MSRDPWKVVPRTSGPEVRIRCELCGEWIGSIFSDELGNIVAETAHRRRKPQTPGSLPAVTGSRDRLRSALASQRTLEVSTIVATCPRHGDRSLTAAEALRAFDQRRRNVGR